MRVDPNKHIIDSASMASDIDTDVLELNIPLFHRTHLCIQMQTNGGDHVGTFYVYGRIIGSGSWCILRQYTVASGTPMNECLDMSNLGVEEVRLLWDVTSGDGVLDVWWISKAGAQ